MDFIPYKLIEFIYTINPNIYRLIWDGITYISIIPNVIEERQLTFIPESTKSNLLTKNRSNSISQPNFAIPKACDKMIKLKINHQDRNLVILRRYHLMMLLIY